MRPPSAQLGAHDRRTDNQSTSECDPKKDEQVRRLECIHTTEHLASDHENDDSDDHLSAGGWMWGCRVSNATPDEPATDCPADGCHAVEAEMDGQSNDPDPNRDEEDPFRIGSVVNQPVEDTDRSRRSVDVPALYTLADSREAMFYYARSFATKKISYAQESVLIVAPRTSKLLVTYLLTSAV